MTSLMLVAHNGLKGEAWPSMAPTNLLKRVGDVEPLDASPIVSHCDFSLTLNLLLDLLICAGTAFSPPDHLCHCVR